MGTAVRVRRRCGGPAGSLSAVFERLDSLEQQLQEERQDKAALRAELADERRQNKAHREENQLLVGQVVGLQTMLYAVEELTNKTRADASQFKAELLFYKASTAFGAGPVEHAVLRGSCTNVPYSSTETRRAER